MLKHLAEIAAVDPSAIGLAIALRAARDGANIAIAAVRQAALPPTLVISLAAVKMVPASFAD